MPRKTPEFARFTAAEEVHVEAILDRALRLDDSLDRESLAMDLSATHARVPLRLEELANADDFNFSHDVGGIIRCMNRKTGELENHFRPRFAKPAG